MLATTLPDSEGNDVLAVLGHRLELDVHVDMSEVLGEGSSGTSDGNDPGLDNDGDSFGDGELFGGENVTHTRKIEICESGNQSSIQTSDGSQQQSDKVPTLDSPKTVSRCYC